MGDSFTRCQRGREHATCNAKQQHAGRPSGTSARPTAQVSARAHLSRRWLFCSRSIFASRCRARCCARLLPPAASPPAPSASAGRARQAGDRQLSSDRMWQVQGEGACAACMPPHAAHAAGWSLTLQQRQCQRERALPARQPGAPRPATAPTTNQFLSLPPPKTLPELSPAMSSWADSKPPSESASESASESDASDPSSSEPPSEPAPPPPLPPRLCGGWPPSPSSSLPAMSASKAASLRAARKKAEEEWGEGGKWSGTCARRPALCSSAAAARLSQLHCPGRPHSTPRARRHQRRRPHSLLAALALSQQADAAQVALHLQRSGESGLGTRCIKRANAV